MNVLAHEPDRCTYRCPNTGEEVLVFRDVRHVVVDGERFRALLDVVEAAVSWVHDDDQTPGRAHGARQNLWAALSRLEEHR